MKIDYKLLDQLKNRNQEEIEKLLKKKLRGQRDSVDGCKQGRKNKEIRASQ